MVIVVVMTTLYICRVRLYVCADTYVYVYGSVIVVVCMCTYTGGKVNILGGHSIGHSKQKCLYEHVSYSERFPR